MAAVVESVSTASYGSGSSKTITKPTGLSVGEMMIADVSLYIQTNDTMTVSTPSGWTLLESSQITGSSLSMAKYVFGKIADSSDVAASNFTFSHTASRYSLGVIYRISNHTGLSLLQSAIANVTSSTSTPSFGNTITPAYTGSLVIMINAMGAIGISTWSTSGYAVANDDPTFVEDFDVYGVGGASLEADGMLAGASALRTETTATGNSTCTTTGGDALKSIGALIVIPPKLSAQVTLDTPNIALTPQALTARGKATVTLDTPNIQLSPQAPIVTTPESKWKNVDKSATSSFTNTPKS